LRVSHTPTPWRSSLSESLGIDWDWIGRHGDDIAAATLAHLELVGAGVGLAVAVSLPLAIAVRNRPVAATLTSGTATVLYTIPSLALFAFLVPFFGIGKTPAIVGLAVYAMGVLIRNTVTGLRGVPAPVLEAARGMGLTRRQILMRVELPLAVPAILTGVRLATIETVAIATIAAFVAGGGLGELILNNGIERNLFVTPIVAGTVIAIAMALTLDLLLVLAERIATPWSRRTAAPAEVAHA
jgi:osmoprotectant transport system permease protein